MLCHILNTCIQQYRSRIVPTISQPHLSTRIKKKMSKLPTLYITYFAAEGLWNIDIIILFCNFDKTNS